MMIGIVGGIVVAILANRINRPATKTRGIVTNTLGITFGALGAQAADQLLHCACVCCYLCRQEMVSSRFHQLRETFRMKQRRRVVTMLLTGLFTIIAAVIFEAGMWVSMYWCMKLF